MRLAVSSRLLFAVILPVVCTTLASSVNAQVSENEMKATALLNEAQSFAVAPAKALTLLDEIEANYPIPSMMPWVKLRRAQCLMYTKKYAEAVTTAQALIESRPNTIEATWAQVTIGQTREAQEKYGDAVKEYLKVADMMPNRTDVTPYDTAMEGIGRIICKDYKPESQTAPNGYIPAEQIMTKLGIDAADNQSKGRILAAVAVKRLQENHIALGYAIYHQIVKECPGSVVEQNWAASKLAAA